MGPKAASQVIVLDTSVLFAEPQAFGMPEFSSLDTIEFVVPLTVLSELDRLMERSDKRDKARAAIHVLKDLVSRGACSSGVSCGSNKTIRIFSVDAGLAGHPELDLAIADDRILAVSLQLGSGQNVSLATTEFAMYAKAISLGLGGFHIERLQDVATTVSRRDRTDFDTKWRRVEGVDNVWAVCRRGIRFLNSRLASQLLAPVRQSHQPPGPYVYLEMFDRLQSKWTADVDLTSIFQEIFGLAPSVPVNYGILQLSIPAGPIIVGGDWQSGMPGRRNETDQERALRIKREEELFDQREEYLTDTLLGYLEDIRQYILDQIGDEDLR